MRKRLPIRLRHFGTDALDQVGVEQRRMILARMDLDHRVAAELGQRFLQQPRGSVQIKRVVGPHEDVDFAGKLRSERFPVPFQQEPDVVFFPRVRDVRMDRPRAAVPKQLRLAVVAARTEDGLEAVQLSAGSENVLHPGKTGEREDNPPSESRQGTFLSRPIEIHVLARMVKIDALKVAKIDRDRETCSTCLRSDRGTRLGATTCSSRRTSGPSESGPADRPRCGKSGQTPAKTPSRAPCRRGRCWPSRQRRGGPADSSDRARRAQNRRRFESARARADQTGLDSACRRSREP